MTLVEICVDICPECGCDMDLYYSRETGTRLVCSGCEYERQLTPHARGRGSAVAKAGDAAPETKTAKPAGSQAAPVM